MWEWYEGQTDTHTQTHVTNIHFTLPTTHVKCKYHVWRQWLPRWERDQVCDRRRREETWPWTASETTARRTCERRDRGPWSDQTGPATVPASSPHNVTVTISVINERNKWCEIQEAVTGIPAITDCTVMFCCWQLSESMRLTLGPVLRCPLKAASTINTTPLLSFCSYASR